MNMDHNYGYANTPRCVSPITDKNTICATPEKDEDKKKEKVPSPNKKLMLSYWDAKKNGQINSLEVTTLAQGMSSPSSDIDSCGINDNDTIPLFQVNSNPSSPTSTDHANETPTSAKSINSKSALGESIEEQIHLFSSIKDAIKYNSTHAYYQAKSEKQHLASFSGPHRDSNLHESSCLSLASATSSSSKKRLRSSFDSYTFARPSPSPSPSPSLSNRSPREGLRGSGDDSSFFGTGALQHVNTMEDAQKILNQLHLQHAAQVASTSTSSSNHATISAPGTKKATLSHWDIKKIAHTKPSGDVEFRKCPYMVEKTPSVRKKVILSSYWDTKKIPHKKASSGEVVFRKCPSMTAKQQCIAEYSLPLILPAMFYLLNLSVFSLQWCMVLVVGHSLETTLTNFGPSVKHFRLLGCISPLVHHLIDCFWLHSLISAMLFMPHRFVSFGTGGMDEDDESWKWAVIYMAILLIQTLPIYLAVSFKTDYMKQHRPSVTTTHTRTSTDDNDDDDDKYRKAKSSTLLIGMHIKRCFVWYWMATVLVFIAFSIVSDMLLKVGVLCLNATPLMLFRTYSNLSVRSAPESIHRVVGQSNENAPLQHN